MGKEFVFTLQSREYPCELMGLVSFHRSYEGAVAKIMALNEKAEYLYRVQYGKDSCFYYSDYGKNLYLIIESELEA